MARRSSATAGAGRDGRCFRHFGGAVRLYSIGVQWCLHTVVETAAFLADARAVGLSEAERFEIVNWIADNPLAGDPIEGTGGARKVRFAGKGKGKSGGYRVITFFSGSVVPVFLLNVFAKNDKTNLTPKERSVLKTVLADIVKAYKVVGRSG